MRAQAAVDSKMVEIIGDVFLQLHCDAFIAATIAARGHKLGSVTHLLPRLARAGYVRKLPKVSRTPQQWLTIRAGDPLVVYHRIRRYGGHRKLPPQLDLFAPGYNAPGKAD